MKILNIIDIKSSRNPVCLWNTVQWSLFVLVCLFSAVYSLQSKGEVPLCWWVDPRLLIKDLSPSMDGEQSNLLGATGWPIWACCRRVLPSIYSAKASHAQLPDIPLRSNTQAPRLIARIPLVQRREKCPSREEKSAFT